ncbi:putative ADP-ribosylation factor GTPase-activating protein AGD6 [Panicum miliaceum]|uniref:ADP-ribosylation factor GTPase-activating protein AGD6 n=1 Tax=Panicum miliaceum TaxID=4540 RepID=A0A3L6TLG2_PANMI|nr:putative ADP-ribosylation factor GTPase-activating protein AGD6 [Panicum miliaceum]
MKAVVPRRRSNPAMVSTACLGKHRGLDVYISSVRSVTMDSWIEAQLRKMEAGGNDRLNAFLAARGVPKETPHAAKYKAAAAYRDRIITLAEGRTWTDPPSSGMSAPAPARKPLVHASAASGSGGGGDWDGLGRRLLDGHEAEPIGWIIRRRGDAVGEEAVEVQIDAGHVH